jgi:hypothetical protein
MYQQSYDMMAVVSARDDACPQARERYVIYFTISIYYSMHAPPIINIIIIPLDVVIIIHEEVGKAPRQHQRKQTQRETDHVGK